MGRGGRKKEKKTKEKNGKREEGRKRRKEGGKEGGRLGGMKERRKCSMRFPVSFTQIPPMLTSRITKAQSQNQVTDVSSADGPHSVFTSFKDSYILVVKDIKIKRRNKKM